MNKEEILQLATDMLESKSVIGAHGTSITNAESIAKTGLNGNRSTFVPFTPSSDPKKLATYCWKENGPNDTANCVIQIPLSFFQKLMGIDKKQLLEWRESIIGSEEAIIYNMADKEISKQATPSPVPRMPAVNFNLPKEFIRGYFIHTNGQSGKDFQTKSLDELCENVDFVENPLYFENLSQKEQDDFVYAKQVKMGIEKPREESLEQQ